MLAKRIIPCLDVDAGRVVKGIRFVDIRDAGDPVEMASVYDGEGADELTFLDITASWEQRETTYDIVRRTAEQVFIPLTVGGGVRAVDDVRRLLRAGADKVAINTAAVRDPEMLLDATLAFGSQCIVIAIDARARNGSWEVVVEGGRTPTGLDAVDWAARCTKDLGAGVPAHFTEAMTDGGADAALAASVFHFGEMRISEVKAECARAGLSMR